MNAPPRHIILCADDYGLAPGVSGAICDLVGRGCLNAVSVMVVSPHFNGAAATALLGAAAGRAAIGLHVTLTAPFAPAAPDFKPLRDGAFPPLAAMVRRAYLRALSPDLLMVEMARQCEVFAAAFGRPPDFLDGHQHIQLFPQIREAFLRVAKQAAPHAWVRQCGQAAPLRRRFADRKALLLDALSHRFRKLAATHGLRSNPAFAGTYAFRADAAYAALFARFLDRLPEGGVIMCHPGKVDAELRRVDPLTDLREREYAFFRSDAFPRLLAERGVALAVAGRMH